MVRFSHNNLIYTVVFFFQNVLFRMKTYMYVARINIICIWLESNSSNKFANNKWKIFVVKQRVITDLVVLVNVNTMHTFIPFSRELKIFSCP